MVPDNSKRSTPPAVAELFSAAVPAALGIDMSAICNSNQDTDSEHDSYIDVSALISIMLAPDNKRQLKEYLGVGDGKAQVEQLSDDEAAEHFPTKLSMRRRKNRHKKPALVEKGPFFRVVIGSEVFYWSLTTLLSLKPFSLICELLELQQRNRQFDPADAFSASMRTVAMRHRNNVSLTINEVFANSSKLTKIRAFCERINNEVFETCVKLYSSILIQVVYIVSRNVIHNREMQDDEMRMLFERLAQTPFKDVILIDGFVNTVPASAAQHTHVKGAGSKIKEGHRVGDRRENLATKNCHLKTHMAFSTLSRALVHMTVTEGVDAEYRYFMPEDFLKSPYSKDSLLVADRAYCVLKLMKQAKDEDISFLVRGKNDLAYKILEIKDKHGTEIPLPKHTYRADGEIKPVSLNDDSMIELVNKYGYLDCIAEASGYVEVRTATEKELALCAPATRPNQKQRKLDCGLIRIVMCRGLPVPLSQSDEQAVSSPCEPNGYAPAYGFAGTTVTTAKEDLVLPSKHDVDTKSDEAEVTELTYDAKTPSNKGKKAKEAEPTQVVVSDAVPRSAITIPSESLRIPGSEVVDSETPHATGIYLNVPEIQDPYVTYELPMILLTNVSADILSVDDVITFYHYRWGVEVGVKALRQGNSLQATHVRRISFALEMQYCSFINYSIKTLFALLSRATTSQNYSPELCQHMSEYGHSAKLGIARYHIDVLRAVHSLYNNYNGVEAATTCNLDVLCGYGEFKPSLRSEGYVELPDHIDFHRNGDLGKNVTLLNGKLRDALDAVNEAIIHPDNTENMQLVEELEECFKASGVNVDFKKTFDKIRYGAAKAGISVSNAIIRPKNLDSISLLKLHSHPTLNILMAGLFDFHSSKHHCSTNELLGFSRGRSFYEILDEVDNLIKSECKEGHISIRTWQQANDMRILASRSLALRSA